VIIGIGFAVSSAERSAAPLLQLLSTAWSPRPEIIERGEALDRWQFMEYHYSRLLGKNPKRRRRVDFIVETGKEYNGANVSKNETEFILGIDIIAY
jgi:hypothetical protein